MSLERLLNPRSIAVFGGAHAEELIRQNDRMAYDGEIWPVHPKKTEVLGRKVYRSVQELPAAPDAAYVGVNRHLTVDIVRDLAARGAGGAICYASGFAEAGKKGFELTRQLLDVSGEMPLVGPNCYGLLNYVDGAMLWPDQQGGRRVDDGVAIITQSSNVGFNLTMQRRGLPIAYMVSLGNKLKFNLSDAIYAFARQDRVTAIGLFLETISDPAAFQQAVDMARRLGKPIVAIKVGHSERAQKMVVSHTASLAGSDTLASALFERLGVARVGSLESFIEALKVLHVLGPLKGGRVGAMSTSGGDLILLADAIGQSLTLPALSRNVTEKLKATVHARVKAANPLDYQMFTWNDEARINECFTAFLSEGFDISLCLLDYPREDICDQSTWGGAERAYVTAVKSTGTKGAVLTTFSDTVSEPVAARLMEEGVVMLAGIEAGLAGVRAAVDIGMAWQQVVNPPLLSNHTQARQGRVRELDEAESKNLLARNGIPVPAAQIVHDTGEALAAADTLGFPVALKALGFMHKTEAGAVRLNLENRDELANAMDQMSGLAGSFLIERMISDAVAELIIGVARDEHYGPYLLVGAGGVLVEMMKDSEAILLPTTREKVFQAMGQLKCAPLLNGYRGAPPADLNAAADIILIIAGLVESDPSSIVELDINPLILMAEGQGAVAVDAQIRLSPTK